MRTPQPRCPWPQNRENSKKNNIAFISDWAKKQLLNIVHNYHCAINAKSSLFFPLREHSHKVGEVPSLNFHRLLQLKPSLLSSARPPPWSRRSYPRTCTCLRWSLIPHPIPPPIPYPTWDQNENFTSARTFRPQLSKGLQSHPISTSSPCSFLLLSSPFWWSKFKKATKLCTLIFRKEGECWWVTLLWWPSKSCHCQWRLPMLTNPFDQPEESLLNT